MYQEFYTAGGLAFVAPLSEVLDILDCGEEELYESYEEFALYDEGNCLGFDFETISDGVTTLGEKTQKQVEDGKLTCFDGLAIVWATRAESPFAPAYADANELVWDVIEAAHGRLGEFKYDYVSGHVGRINLAMYVD